MSLDQRSHLSVRFKVMLFRENFQTIVVFEAKVTLGLRLQERLPTHLVLLLGTVPVGGC